MNDQERLLDLFTARATEGLSAEESRQLELALRGPIEVDAADLDLAAAAAALAFESASIDSEPMPDSLKERILAQAVAHLVGDQHGARELRPPVTRFQQPESKPKRGWLDIRSLGWYAAAAILALALWSPWSGRPTTTPTAPTLVEQRAALIDEAADVIQVSWAKPEIPEYANVQGDVVWSNQRQAGYMRLSGLPANRSEIEQYQLWIVDPSRDQHPTDGGVFDIPAGVEEVIVPIDAKLPVDSPTVFAITLEKAGGVVVSDGPLLVVAPVQA